MSAEKAKSTADVYNKFYKTQVAVETKYDGERSVIPFTAIDIGIECKYISKYRIKNRPLQFITKVCGTVRGSAKMHIRMNLKGVQGFEVF